MKSTRTRTLKRLRSGTCHGSRTFTSEPLMLAAQQALHWIPITSPVRQTITITTGHRDRKRHRSRDRHHYRLYGFYQEGCCYRNLLNRQRIRYGASDPARGRRLHYMGSLSSLDGYPIGCHGRKILQLFQGASKRCTKGPERIYLDTRTRK